MEVEVLAICEEVCDRDVCVVRTTFRESCVDNKHRIERESLVGTKVSLS